MDKEEKRSEFSCGPRRTDNYCKDGTTETSDSKTSKATSSTSKILPGEEQDDLSMDATGISSPSMHTEERLPIQEQKSSPQTSERGASSESSSNNQGTRKEFPGGPRCTDSYCKDGTTETSDSQAISSTSKIPPGEEQDDMSMDATVIPSTSMHTEKRPPIQAQKSSPQTSERGASSESSSNNQGTRKATDREQSPFSFGGLEPQTVNVSNAENVQFGQKCTINVRKTRGGGRTTPINKKEGKKETVNVSNVENVQFGQECTITVTETGGGGDTTPINEKEWEEGHEEFLKTEGQDVFTGPQLRAMNKVMQSVGSIVFPSGRGTAFLVGSLGHYIFTAWHIVRDIISVRQIGTDNSDDLNRLASHDVYVNFGDIRSAEAYKYLLKPIVIFYDDNLDVALLQLQEKTEGGNNVVFPPTLGTFIEMTDVTEVAILGHGNPDGSVGVMADTKCEVINKGSSLLQEAIQWFNSKGRNIVGSLLQLSHKFCTPEESPYDLAINTNFIVCNSYITTGASGSPMVTMMGKVVGVYTCGIPGSYWKIKQDLRSEFPKKYVFGCGATMKAIHSSMQKFKEFKDVELTENIMQDIFRQ